ncbi:four-carbon acid sugar kinase family protein [Phycicoccus sp. M110.8]|uniref:four-carbon acid sugar kinase family protein n=1 Tax=Phycicoccus sp. M110.8 TaxID=3075433 RepID=UPI0028FDB0CE|nr:four-carbon acid sugar kinase family protein [Phycicoccus sp. M110.8]MDU0313650.1 four-carbon acid sugar kinase family protein [Phycicoccus sp. M110.8]
MTEQLILADDLSGASEAAAQFLLRTTRILVDCSPQPATGRSATRVRCVDLHTRHAPGPVVTDRVRTALAAAGCPQHVLVKVDSLLRGTPEHLVRAVREALTPPGYPAPPVVICPATPTAGRTVVGGVVHVAGRPLHETDLWHAEHRTPPGRAAEALPGLDVLAVPLDVVRGPRSRLVAAMLDATRTGRTCFCDAETDADLDTLVAAAAELPGAVLVGAGGLAAAAARALRPDVEEGDVCRDGAAPASRVLVVAGSAAPGLAREVAELAAAGADVVEPTVADLLAGTAVLPDLGASAPVTVVRPAAAPVDPSVSTHLVAALADAVVPAVPATAALVLTGGETARAVLDRLGVRSLRPVRADAGAVTALADDGRTVVTRPGSFGHGAALADIVTTLTHRPHQEPS